ncbi:hypothetical protein AB0M43_33710 [Longispora sp. NPDC051575]|uniref:hypothetical protein n=1 Tax=Longispora sp. NPDC051575 TaxID=3154943 RepID=UPI0034366A7F
MTSTPTRTTAKGHNLNNGDTLLWFGRNDKRAYAEGILVTITKNQMGCEFRDADGKLVEYGSCGVAGKFWAAPAPVVEDAPAELVEAPVDLGDAGTDIRVGDTLLIPAAADLGARRADTTIRVTKVDAGPCWAGRRFVYGYRLNRDGSDRKGQTAPTCFYVTAARVRVTARPAPVGVEVTDAAPEQPVEQPVAELVERGRCAHCGLPIARRTHRPGCAWVHDSDDYAGRGCPGGADTEATPDAVTAADRYLAELLASMSPDAARGRVRERIRAGLARRAA